MPKEYKLVLFDLDGTLIDTSPGIYNGLDYMLEEMGEPPIDVSLKPNFVGPPVIETYPKFFNFSGERLKRAIKLYRSHGQREGYLQYRHYPGITDLLSYLKENGYNSVVVTMKEETLARKQLENAELMPLLTLLIGNNDTTPYTKSELVDLAIDKFGVIKEETLLVGDTGVDAKGARDSDVDFFPAMYGFGFNFKDETEDYPYVKKLYAPEELIDVLEGRI